MGGGRVPISLTPPTHQISEFHIFQVFLRNTNIEAKSIRPEMRFVLLLLILASLVAQSEGMPRSMDKGTYRTKGERKNAASRSTRRTSAHRASMARWALLSSITEDVEDVLGPGFGLGGARPFRRSSAVARAPTTATAAINGADIVLNSGAAAVVATAVPSSAPPAPVGGSKRPRTCEARSHFGLTLVIPLNGTGSGISTRATKIAPRRVTCRTTASTSKTTSTASSKTPAQQRGPRIESDGDGDGRPQGPFTLAMPSGMPTDAYLSTFETNSHAARALFWARTGSWRFADWRNKDLDKLSEQDEASLGHAIEQEALVTDADLERMLKGYHSLMDPRVPVHYCGACGTTDVPISGTSAPAGAAERMHIESFSRFLFTDPILVPLRYTPDQNALFESGPGHVNMTLAGKFLKHRYAVDRKRRQKGRIPSRREGGARTLSSGDLRGCCCQGSGGCIRTDPFDLRNEVLAAEGGYPPA